MLTHELIESNARRLPHAVAWEYAGRRRTWAEADEATASLAANLAGLSFRPGDRVGLFSENSDHLADLYFAFARCGLVAAPINPRSVRREIDFILADVGARGLIVSSRLASRLKAAQEDRPSAGVEILIGIGEGHGCPVGLAELYATAPRIAPPTRDDAIRAIKYTSGTTGAPKGCISTQRQFLFSIQNYLIQTPFADDDRCLLSLPMTAGVGIYLLTAYAYMGLPTVIHDRFDPDAFLDEIQNSRITRFYAVPTMLSALLNALAAKPRDLSSLRYVGYGGAPAAFALIKRAVDAFKCGFYQTFGASEGGGFITYLKPRDHSDLIAAGGAVTDRAGTSIMPCGREVQGFNVRIVDDKGSDVPDGEVGEMWIRSDSTMSGYWNRPEQTAGAVRDGWLASGDLAVRDANGILSIVDRKRDMIVSGGLNIYSSEVEAVIQEHPGVAEAAVVGVPDPHWSEVVTAFVVRHEGCPCTAEDLAGICEAALASYKRPKAFHFVDSLPKTSTGKVRKLELRKLAGSQAAAGDRPHAS
jgi:acyl-CoA synthetase (AMP-forming)/AMP-acid ligase II